MHLTLLQAWSYERLAMSNHACCFPDRRLPRTKAPQKVLKPRLDSP